jgi:rare lipoprotein A
MKKKFWSGSIFLLPALLYSCSVISTTYDVTKGTIKTAYKTARFAGDIGWGTGKLAYMVGKYTYELVMAPMDWPMTHEEIETIEGLPPKEAIRQGKVKNSPYTVMGRFYRPMTVDAAQTYKESGIASWYGYETLRQKDGHMTANGEAFDPLRPTAAHKYLPLPTNVKVTNLENGRSMILRVNDRGPFVDGRIIDLSAGAAQKLGFYRKGTVRVRVETMVN